MPPNPSVPSERMLPFAVVGRAAAASVTADAVDAAAAAGGVAAASGFGHAHRLASTVACGAVEDNTEQA